MNGAMLVGRVIGAALSAGFGAFLAANQAMTAADRTAEARSEPSAAAAADIATASAPVSARAAAGDPPAEPGPTEGDEPPIADDPAQEANAAELAAVVAAPEDAPARGDPPVSPRFTPDPTLSLCPRIRISNAPAAEEDRRITGYKPFVEPAPGVFVAVAPTNGACLTSGFGFRRGKLHKGVDLQSRPASMIVAAAPGVVAEARYRPDFGNFVLIDHGGGVHTRYAHLQAIEPGLRPGAPIAFGAPLGMMGDTSAYKVALHLHYEILLGDLANPKGSFGLTPIDPFALEMVGARAQAEGR
ncbi:MAG: M23 family metallopeptidase [Pseudomonadota bacterium]